MNNTIMYHSPNNYHFSLRLYKWSEKNWTIPYLYVSEEDLIAFLKDYFEIKEISPEFKRWVKNARFGDTWGDKEKDFIVVAI